MRLTHPQKGEVKVRLTSGCSQIRKRTALRLIRELEEGRAMDAEELEWLKGLTEAHPVLRRLPKLIKEQLFVAPSESLRGLPECNRRRRRIMEEKGFAVHLYAGPREGYTLLGALKEVGGDTRRLLEIDVLREGVGGEGEHDMLTETGPYPKLLRAALDGQLQAIIMGPNCRTRSVLADTTRWTSQEEDRDR